MKTVRICLGHFKINQPKTSCKKYIQTVLLHFPEVKSTLTEKNAMENVNKQTNKQIIEI